MVPEEHIYVYKREWRKKGFKKKYLRWYKSYDEITLCFCIRNFQSGDWYVPWIGALLNSEMEKPYPRVYDEAYIFASRFLTIDFEKVEDNGGLIQIDPQKAISEAMKHFEHMTTIDDLMSYIINNELFGMTLEKLEKRIYR